MTEEDIVLFKLKSLTDNGAWEDIEPIGKLTCEDAPTASVIAHALSGLFNQECRWNWVWSTQGHYETHQDTLQKFFDERRKQ